ncbi:MAG: zinc-ribbon domain-containing protein [Methanoregula sp.]
MIVLQFCPQCGNAVKPENKFCRNCGASLSPDLFRDDETASPQPVQPGRFFRVSLSGISSRNGLIAVAGLVIIILIISFIGYPLLMVPGTPTSGTPASPATMQPPAGVPKDYQGGSYVIVETEEPTPLPATGPIVAVTTQVPTTLITTRQTTAQITEYLVCPADRLACNNTCVDLRTDNNNCGYCNNSCPVGTSCLNGNCALACSAGQASCLDGCFDLLTDPRHCGSCQNSCPKGLICSAGRCDSPATPMLVPQ